MKEKECEAITFLIHFHRKPFTNVIANHKHCKPKAFKEYLRTDVNYNIK